MNTLFGHFGLWNFPPTFSMQARLPVIVSGGVTTLDEIHKVIAFSRSRPKFIGRAIDAGTRRVAEAIEVSAGESMK